MKIKITNKIYNIKSNLNKKICLISDLHYSDRRDIERLYKVLDNIKNIKPNYICITGDMIDKSKIYDEEIFINWLKKLSRICKVIISIGNHEFYIDKQHKIFELNKSFFKKISNIKNVYLLDNKSLIIDGIRFIGLTLPIEFYYDQYKSIDTLLDKFKLDKKYYNILLCHSPINVLNQDFNNKNIDLVLCGHMHGGVVPRFLRFIFKNRGIINPSKKLFPKYAYGLFKKDNTNIITTSGIKVLPSNKLTKLFNPEIAIIYLTFKKIKYNTIR